MLSIKGDKANSIYWNLISFFLANYCTSTYPKRVEDRKVLVKLLGSTGILSFINIKMYQHLGKFSSSHSEVIWGQGDKDDLQTNAAARPSVTPVPALGQGWSMTPAKCTQSTKLTAVIFHIHTGQRISRDLSSFTIFDSWPFLTMSVYNYCIKISLSLALWSSSFHLPLVIYILKAFNINLIQNYCPSII